MATIREHVVLFYSFPEPIRLHRSEKKYPRLAIASTFCLSGRARVSGLLTIKDSTCALFEQERGSGLSIAFQPLLFCAAIGCADVRSCASHVAVRQSVCAASAGHGAPPCPPYVALQCSIELLRITH